MTAQETLQKCVEFDRENKHLYNVLSFEVRRVYETGRRKHLGIAMFEERLRWIYDIETSCDEPFKIPSRMGAYYARKLVVEGVVPYDFFRFKNCRADYLDYSKGEVVDFPWFRVWYQHKWAEDAVKAIAPYVYKGGAVPCTNEERSQI